ncbi:mitochondrial carrier superfamily protein [Toxoplasma gondii TgCatPRC2]|uniref:Carrier superfamily protein n=6 Tax=Toxoplasma gondii TaxID=5811 RepID=A0A125YGY5_TOXGV|nr:carrier superfamily protein [Toxoplasma gondii ME49]ESS35413.1 carrier superfamily protein [Toxoplasma gondii VEG]KFG37046.1 mitochondrial carrier superfamily protein [Toxoplasma gondii GAB2-2007-GAL-DOM2]KYF40112.1 mitochondrial carrier superfamily protein [Toxoplasma gondii ARI]KYK65787.1 mitochondrial carrier superfamily protein [Toxoplasma gondii TgCatPRC2]EPT25804.1 carrier superfamily protein [Toxoplasma gondii ME49]|eukprot:XP_018635362.1 carrier superfamily protein [Toxoplasma gondii ME49]
MEPSTNDATCAATGAGSWKTVSAEHLSHGESDDSSIDWRKMRALMFASACSGFVGRCLFYPIDTAKAMIQAQVTSRQYLGSSSTVSSIQPCSTIMSSGTAQLQQGLSGEARGPTRGAALGQAADCTPAKVYRSLLTSTGHALKMVWRQEGIPGLYRGFVMCGVGSLPATCLFFTSFEIIRAYLVRVCSSWANGDSADPRGGDDCASSAPGKTLPTPISPLIDLVSGFGAEAISCVFWVPIDVCKERLQTQRVLGTSAYRGSWDCVNHLFKQEGLRQLYKGYGATLLSFGPLSALFFMFDNQLKNIVLRILHRQQDAGGPNGLVENRHPSSPDAISLIPLATGGCALVAAASAAWLTVPLDKVKLRLQVQRGQMGTASRGTPFLYRNTFHGLATVYKEEGTRGLFRGSGARVLFHSANFALLKVLIEHFKSAYLEYAEPASP